MVRKIRPIFGSNGNVVNKSEVIAQCPTIGCNRRFRLTLKNREKYCPECGQKLNWSVLDGYRMVEDVKGCTAPRCPLYAFRFGKNPYIHREMSEEQRQAAAERLAEARYKKGSENEDKT